MNNGPLKANEFSKELNKLINKKNSPDIDFAIAAPFVSLAFMMPNLEEGENVFIPLAAQNVYHEEKGAYTGEISLSFLEELMVDYVIVGHSERREIFGETDELINKKIHSILKTDIIPIFAFGETLEQFEKNETLNVLKKQLLNGLKGVSSQDAKKIVLAYEPIWAIGTGKTATPEQAQNVIASARKIIEKKYDEETADAIRIQYGGSVNSSNIKELMNQKDIDGALVGGASLDVKSFFELITFNK